MIPENRFRAGQGVCLVEPEKSSFRPGLIETMHKSKSEFGPGRSMEVILQGDPFTRDPYGIYCVRTPNGNVYFAHEDELQETQ